MSQVSSAILKKKKSLKFIVNTHIHNTDPLLLKDATDIVLK